MLKWARSIRKLLVGPQSFLPVDPQLTGTSDSTRLSHGGGTKRKALLLPLEPRAHAIADSRFQIGKLWSCGVSVQGAGVRHVHRETVKP